MRGMNRWTQRKRNRNKKVTGKETNYIERVYLFIYFLTRSTQ